MSVPAERVSHCVVTVTVAVPTGESRRANGLRRGAGAVAATLGLLSGLALAVAVWTSGPASALAYVPPTTDDTPVKKPSEPKIKAASGDGEKSLAGFKVPAGLSVELVAAEPLVANPVAFGFDEQGRLFVCETFRQSNAVVDNRKYMHWLDDDLAARTVADRLAYYRKHLKDKLADFSKEDDRIRLLEDRDGDGRYEHSTVFAEGFNHPLEGTGAGVLARKGTVWYTNIPHLWQLKDTDGDGKADVRTSLQQGYGVRVAFRGHDMHGLRFGPDGRLYFSIGDRGFHVEHEGKTHALPDQGAVLRCWPDGSELEVVHTGLRNPQELAFDEFGNLFTGDNNSDSGDKARWVEIVPGGDSGWRMYYQYLSDRGPWNREKLWHPQHEGQPAYIVPPIINIADGPSGLCYYPGLGLSERYQGHFFLADFRGDKSRSGIRSFAVKPKGASFELVDSHEFLWNVLATDVDFAPDGSLYVSDWVEGWDGPGKGRIHRLVDPAYRQSAAARQVKQLLADGFDRLADAQLVDLLAHPHQQVRQEAQFALAERPQTALALFAKTASSEKRVHPRLHAVWGLGQLARKNPAAVGPLVALVGDTDVAVRTQAVRTLSDLKAIVASSGTDSAAGVSDKLLAALQDGEPRVRFFAAMAAGRHVREKAIAPLLQLAKSNNDADPYLRHGVMMGLTHACTSDPAALTELLAQATDPAPAARRAILLTLRKLKHAELARFLNDSDLSLVEEAVLAIHDLPLTQHYPAVAALATRTGFRDSVWSRVLNALYRMGGAEQAKAVAGLATRSDLPEKRRIEAVELLRDWEKPSGRDKVLCDWRPLEPRAANIASDALRASLGKLVATPTAVRNAVTAAAAKLGITEVIPVLKETLAATDQPANTRADALQGLLALDAKQAEQALPGALADAAPLVRATARGILADRKPAEALPLLAKAVDEGALIEKQLAFAALGKVKGREAEPILAGWAKKLASGEVAPEVRLDLLEALRLRGEASLKTALAGYEATRNSNDPVSVFREAVSGGDAERGRQIFFERQAVSCVRCHKVKGTGGEVGPELSKIAVEKNRDYLLEAVVAPNKQIAKGFASVVLILTSGKNVTGIIKNETPQQVQVMLADGRLQTIATRDIEERAAGKSAMPEDVVKFLTPADVRDVVEYLSTLK